MEFLEFIIWFEWSTLLSTIAIGFVVSAIIGEMVDVELLVDITIGFQTFLLIICFFKLVFFPYVFAVADEFIVHSVVRESFEKRGQKLSRWFWLRVFRGLFKIPRAQNEHSVFDPVDHEIKVAYAALKDMREQRSPNKSSDKLKTASNKATQVLRNLVGNFDQKDCILFKILPLELRRMIYANLLITGIIENPDKILNDKMTCFVYSEKDGRSNGLNLNVAILRTCRLIYHEALPMLYQENTFAFCSPDRMQDFRARGLIHMASHFNEFIKVPAFNFAPCNHGRLFMIRKLIVNLTDELSLLRLQQLPPGQFEPMRAAIRLKWGFFLNENLYRDNEFETKICFPALTDLTLDFSDWRLSQDDALVIRPFVERFKTSEKLSRLEVKGVPNKRSLLELRKEMLAEGGTFVTTS